MSINKSDLEDAAKAGIIQQEQISALLLFFSERDNKIGKARFTSVHVLFYLGGMLAIGAASVFTTIAVEAFGMSVLFFSSLIYAVLALLAASWFEKRKLGVPAGIFATLAIALTPLIIFAFQNMMGYWSGDSMDYHDYHRIIDCRWLLMEIGTLVSGIIVLWRFRYTFLVMPLALTLWYMSMDIIPAILAQNILASSFSYSWDSRLKISLIFGGLMLLFAFYVNLRTSKMKDYSYWLYIFGLLTFWGALSSMGNGELSGKFVYLFINFLLVGIGAIIGRPVFTVFGGIGIMLVLGNLSWGYFKNSFSFVLALTVLGFGLIAVGAWWTKHEAEISARLSQLLPANIRDRLTSREL
jgi:MFS family permease